MHHSGQKRRAPSSNSWGAEKRFKGEESKEAREARKLQEEIDRLSMQLGAVEEKLNAKVKQGSPEPESDYNSDLDNELHDLVDSDSYDETPTTLPPKKKPHRDTKSDFRESRGEFRESRNEYHREPRSDHREIKYESSKSSNSSSHHHAQSSPPEERRVSKRVTKPTNKYRGADNALDVLDVESPHSNLVDAQPGAAAPKPRRATTPKSPKTKKPRVIFQTPAWDPILKSSNPTQLQNPLQENVPLVDTLKKSAQQLTAEKARLERSLSDLEAQCSKRATDNNESEDKSPPLRPKSEFEANKTIPDYSDRCRLCNAINGLQDKYMAGVVSIFQEELPAFLKKPQNLTCDIDIDALPPLVVRRLLAYIDDCKEADNRAMNFGGEGTGPIETVTNGTKIGNDSTLGPFAQGGETNGITYPPPKTETVEGTDKKSSSSTASSETSDTSSSEDDSD